MRLRQVLVTTTPCGGVLEGTLRRYTPQEACDHIQSVNDAMRRIAQARAPPAAPDDVVPTGGLAECKCKCKCLIAVVLSRVYAYVYVRDVLVFPAQAHPARVALLDAHQMTLVRATH